MILQETIFSTKKIFRTIFFSKMIPRKLFSYNKIFAQKKISIK